MTEEEVLMRVADSLGDEIFGLCSGGKDSMSACYVAHQHRPLNGIVTVDTTCAFFRIIDGVKVYPAHEAAKKFAKSLGVPFYLVKNKNPDAYKDYCLKYGMPHQSQHSQVYWELKWKPLMAWARARKVWNADHTEEKLANVCFISGVRSKESRKRMISAKPAQVDEGYKRVRYVAPIISWNTAKTWSFCREKGFELSEVYDAIHISGDCGCGAYAAPEEALLIKATYNDYYHWLMDIESIAKKVTNKGNKVGGWGNGSTLKNCEGQKGMCDYACGDCQNG